MIEQFKDNEVRNSGVIYSSTLEQIKQLYAVDPEQAGELAIAAIELVLTGDISTDDYMISMMLTPMRRLNEINVAKYESKVENQRQKKIQEMKLDKIAELVAAGFKQREIGERLGMSQQIVSYRVGLIKKNYPELLQKNAEDFTKIQTTYKNTKNEVFVENSTNILQTKPNVYKNTNDTKNENFVQKVVCKMPEPVEETGENSDWKTKFKF